MNRYIYNSSILSLAALLVIASACEKEKPSDEEILNERQAATTQLEVSYAFVGQEVSVLDFSSAASRYELEVNMNNENLRWNVESNRDWCVVLPESHKGSGKVTLMIDANESFDPRVPATLTFVAGEYRGASVKVNQRASTFIVGQPYLIAPIDGGLYSTQVITAPGSDWECEGSDWLQVSKGATTSTPDYDITTINITPAANSSESRYGAITLKAGQETEQVFVWQFGTDLDYDENGNIYFDSRVPARVSFTAPAYTVKSVQVPEFGQTEVTENGDGTSTVTILLSENLSDCSEVRTVNVSVALTNTSASVVTLPVLVQDYVPAHGLVTPKGFNAFAQAVATGSDTSDWERDGEVYLVQDINMEEESGWAGIGSAEHPFTGIFNGAGHAILNLKGATAGLFNYTQDATIKGVTLGKGSSLYNNTEYNGKAALGGIVSNAKNTKVISCGFAGEMEVAADLAEEGVMYAGGVVGWADATSSIEACKMTGTLFISSPGTSDIDYYVGGIAGLCEGSLTASEMSGSLQYSSSVETVYLGGIEGSLKPEAQVGNNTFNGSILLGGGAKEAAVGGLYGSIESSRSFNHAQDKSISMGSIRIQSYLSSDSETYVFAGGMVGLAKPGITLSYNGYENKTGFLLNQSAALFSRYICIGGILGGCSPEDEDGALASLQIESCDNTGAISVRYGTGRSNVRHGLFGGIAGFINGPATLTSCTNGAAIGAADVSKDESGTAGNARCGTASNDYNEIIGGVVGYAKGGNQVLSSCANGAAVTNLHYTNRPSTSSIDGMYCSQVSGGILGAFEYTPSPDGNFALKIDNCTNSANGQVLCFRGYAGGIVGFCRNATITGSSSSGFQAAAANDNAYYRGGIAGGAINSTFTSCWAKCSINSGAGGSAEAAFTGGILGWAMGDDPIKIQSCSFNGTAKCTKSGDKPIYPGGIIGAAHSNTTISACKYGGQVQDLTITANNALEVANAVGNYGTNPGCTVAGLEYWDGKM